MIELYSKSEIEKVRKASKVTATVLNELKSMVKEGVNTWDLEMYARERTKELGGIPAFLNYKPPFSKKVYPAALCVSVNDEIVHGLPRKNYKIKNGDIISLDFGVIIEGYAGDSALSVGVGNLDDDKKRLMEATMVALKKAVEVCIPGNKIEDIAKTISNIAKEFRVSPICNYGGHGIGRTIHEEPFIPNCPNILSNKENYVLKNGMVIAIEPMFVLGKNETYVKSDGWTVATKDGSYAAHFEYTIAILDNKPQVLTEIEI